MITVDLQTAVRDIVGSTVKRTTKDPTAYPFFFIAGAGISAPHVPTAPSIVQRCQDAAAELGVSVPELSDDPMERYERMLTLVHPNAADRQEFFHDLIQAAPISPANLRLAHLLESRKLTNLVVTPNFDEMLSKSLRLFGIDCVVCDHPKTTQRVNPNRADLLQIVHVHGTHWFYDCCNLKGEIALRATSDDTDNVSMADLLNRILADRSPIVIGYSGWTSDVIMTAIRRWLRQPARPHNLYWFCYRRAEAAELPEWLREHASVRLVVPAEGEVLEARAVFEAMITKLNVPSPRITSAPLEFFAEQLEAALGASTAGDEKDIYLIQQVIARVRRGVQLENEERGARSAASKRNEELLTQVSDAIRRAAYKEALKAASGVQLDLLEPGRVAELEAAMKELYVSRSVAAPDEALAAARMWSKAAETRSRTRPAPEVEDSLAFAMYAIAFALGGMGDHKGAVAAVDDLLARFSDSPVDSVRRRLVMAMDMKSEEQLHSRDRRAALRTLDEIQERFGSDPTLVAEVASSALSRLMLSPPAQEEVIRICDDFIGKFGAVSGIAHHCVWALTQKAKALTQLERHRESAAAYSEIIEKYGAARNDSTRVFIADAFLGKARAYDALRDDEALQETLARFRQAFGKDDIPAIRGTLKKAEALLVPMPKPPPKPAKKPRRKTARKRA